ncbi:EAL domain-containing protein [Pseudomonas sp. JS3066]|uniref:cyclic di-GMP receptor LapD n=1 Tax=unclassified Pseudomonas TaxID=196821 RepID=UPI00129E6AC0|nr:MULTISPECIES: EAL domain-containing protein [unclassified Pseudomonas]MDH4651520.1 EAL domain-containing protein [Pseudomonas sp. BN606]MRK19230.1 EAL domain-containing protein [Pseudomonas sp. JG-B]WVK94927.1 EAL domain-containing protein [Pseudomonas sp. JS3066]
MSLLKQLFLAICLLLALAFAGSFLAGVESSREQLLSQLRSHAQDAATALGLSMTPHVDDPAMIELMVSSIFDSGYFASIRVVRIPDGGVIAERRTTTSSDQVPNWFAHLVNLRPQGGDALIMRGWQQAARVEVLSHPQFALAKLWDSAIGSLAWLLLCGLVSALAGGWLLRTQLRPLDNMVQQAEAISRREFLALPKVPRTPELRRVVLAMNQMVDKLRNLFAEEAARSERLREEAYQDSLTGLANRRQFDIRLANQLVPNDQNAAGYLLLLRVNDLGGLNQRLGGQRTDALIRDVGEILENLVQQRGNPEWLASRSRGGEFALLSPGVTGEDTEQLAATLAAQLENLHAIGASDRSPVALLGIAAYRPGEDIQRVMGRADQALAQAAQSTERPWVRLDDFDVAPGQSLHDWRAWIDEALNKGKLRLYFQPVSLCANTAESLHHKVLARLLDPQGEAVPAGRFLPWIERLGWAARFDLAMLEHCLAHLQQTQSPIALSLSAVSLQPGEHRERLLALLKAHPQQATLLTLELDERHLPPANELGQVCQAIRETGYSVGLQHFGGRFSLIGNLAHLGLAYLKIDGTYIRAIDQESDKRLFIEALFRATNSIDLPLIAEMVETQGELDVLRELGIQGAMGRLIGAPAPWHE